MTSQTLGARSAVAVPGAIRRPGSVAKRRVPQGAVPAHLDAFCATDWPGSGLEAFDAWKRARHDYLDEHGWPGGALAVLRQEYALRRVLEG